MRFVPDGPDIPNDLIRKWREGKVLFLAGAGVSVPSHLPLFEGLALSVYEVLNDSLFSILKDARAIVDPEARKKCLEAAELSPDRQVEASLFLDKQFDRFFSALEKRFDPDIKGRTKTRYVRDAVEQILSGQQHSNTHRNLLRLSLAPNSSGDFSQPASCRIVTTNFDLLFEEAWKAEFNSQPLTFDARMAPRSGAHNFSGIIHLHGSLSSDAKIASNCILSSRDFARVRAKRWDAMPSDLRKQIEGRLLNGPPVRNIVEEDNVPERVVNLPRDHELARIVDTALDVPLEFQKIIFNRRATDPEFPKLVPMVESRLASGRVSWFPEGSPDKFKNVPISELLSELAKSIRLFGEGDDAEAFAKNIEGKRRILDALEAGPVEDDIAEKGWRLLLSYSHEKDDDPQNDKIIVERIARLALTLSPTMLGRIADQLSYWIDAADEKAPRFDGSNEMWFALLPHAASQAERTSESGTSGSDTDLTSAALNEPLGHLLSFFVRRCPTIPVEGERPPMPQNFIAELKKLAGRARELLANRLAIQTNYFALADNDWLTELVINPMTEDGGESDKIWEAFTKYSRVPPPRVWQQLQHHAFRRLRSAI
jgi:hypothetical protein